MNTLQELNDYGDDQVSATDERTPDIIINPDPAPNQSISISEGQSHNIPTGIDVLEIIQYDVADVYYQIDISACPTAIVTWNTIPAGMTASNPTSGIYQIGPLNDPQDWNNIKSPLVTQSGDFYGIFTYTAGFIYKPDGSSEISKLFTVACNIAQGTDLSSSSPMSYDENTTNNIINQPTVISPNNTTTFSLTITPTDLTIINTISSSGSGGTVSFNNTSKVYTISGTKTQINSHLNSLSFSANNYFIDFLLNYRLIDTSTNIISVKYQDIKNNNLLIMSNALSDGYYNEGQTVTISGGPVITNIAEDNGGNYTITIAPTDTNAVSTLSLTGTGLTTSFNGSTKTLTVIGSKTNFNNAINNIQLTAAGDYAQPIIFLVYRILTPTTKVGARTQKLYINIVDQEIININYSRLYDKNWSTAIFSSNTPQIDDYASADQIYTINFSCSHGYIGPTFGTPSFPVGPGYLIYPTSNTSYALTGTKNYINSKFSLIKYYPPLNFTGSATIVYTQIKNNITQITQSIALNYSNIISSQRNNVIFNVGAVDTSIPNEHFRYQLADIILVGNGGAINNMPALGQGGAGGGGVQYVLNANFQSLDSSSWVFGVGPIYSGYDIGPYSCGSVNLQVTSGNVPINATNSNGASSGAPTMHTGGGTSGGGGGAGGNASGYSGGPGILITSIFPDWGGGDRIGGGGNGRFGYNGLPAGNPASAYGQGQGRNTFPGLGTIIFRWHN